MTLNYAVLSSTPHGRTQKSTFFHQDHKWENKAYTILKSFLTLLYYSARILPQFIITADYHNVIRVTKEAGLI